MTVQPKPNYTNPLTMMKQTKNNSHLGIVSKQKTENNQATKQKNDDVQQLQMEKQMAQTQMVLLNSDTSGGGKIQQAQQEALNQKVEELSQQVREVQSQNYETYQSSQSSSQALATIQSSFDTYAKAEKPSANDSANAVRSQNRFDTYVKEDKSEDNFTGIYTIHKGENKKINADS